MCEALARQGLDPDQPRAGEPESQKDFPDSPIPGISQKQFMVRGVGRIPWGVQESAKPADRGKGAYVPGQSSAVRKGGPGPGVFSQEGQDAGFQCGQVPCGREGAEGGQPGIQGGPCGAKTPQQGGGVPWIGSRNA